MIKRQYFGSGNDIFNEEVFENLTNAFTDSGFFYGSDRMARYVEIKTRMLFKNKTKDWALVQNAALVGVEVSLG